jgi:hypothetical protein
MQQPEYERRGQALHPSEADHVVLLFIRTMGLLGACGLIVLMTVWP